MRTVLKRLGLDSAYLLSSFPVAIPAFVIAVVGFSAGTGLAVVWIGVAVLAITLQAARGFAAIGRTQLASVIDAELPAPYYSQPPHDASRLRKFVNPLTCIQSWMNLLWSVINFPLAVFGFCVAVSWWAAALGSLTWPLYGWIIERAGGDHGIDQAAVWLGLGDSYGAASLVSVLGGLILTLLLPLVLRGATLMQSGVARGMLASIPAPEHRRAA